MASYRNDGPELEFPTLRNADGGVLVVPAGAVFEGPEGLVLDGVTPVKGKKIETPEEKA
jgi:hypothetical protein